MPMAQEVWKLVQSWYLSRGRQVPSDEDFCMEEITKEKKEKFLFETFMTRNLLKDELELEKDYAEKAKIMEGIAACDAILGPQVTQVKPVHGSPEFWKAWAKKKAGWEPKHKTKVN